METRINPEDRAAWLAAAANAGFSPSDSREELMAKAAELGFDATWLLAQGQEVLGIQREHLRAYRQSDETYYEGELLTAEALEDAICLVIGRALVAQTRSSESAE